MSEFFKKTSFQIQFFYCLRMEKVPNIFSQMVAERPSNGNRVPWKNPAKKPTDGEKWPILPLILYQPFMYTIHTWIPGFVSKCLCFLGRPNQPCNNHELKHGVKPMLPIRPNMLVNNVRSLVKFILSCLTVMFTTKCIIQLKDWLICQVEKIIG